MNGQQDDSSKQSSMIQAQPTLNPFTPDDKDLMIRIVKDANDHLDLIQRAEQAGLDMTEQRNRAEMHKQVASKLLEQFFPTTIYPGKVME